MNLSDFFNMPTHPRQKQYEAIREIVIYKKSANHVAEKYNYSVNTIYTLMRDMKAGKLNLFPDVGKGPAKRRTPKETVDLILELRNKDLSVVDINKVLAQKKVIVSQRTIERILQDHGIGKLARRSNQKRGLTKNGKHIPSVAENLDFSTLKKFTIDCPVAGLYFFIPYIIESGLLDIVKKCELPGSKIIGNIQACLCMLAFKLMGGERLSQIDQYSHEQGLGLFAGVGVLPKHTYMGNYSCMTSEEMVNEFQDKLVAQFIRQHPHLYNGDYINLDFHSIPHYGDKSQMEKVWCGARNKPLKGANTVLAQDASSNLILYTRSDILRKEETQEVLRFVEYWRQIKGKIEETLVFDCKFTSYKILDLLSDQKIKYITLRKRNTNLIKRILNTPADHWAKCFINIPKRKHKKISVMEEIVKIRSCNNDFRQVIIKDHGRELPTFILTNDFNIKLKDILEVYARRWRIENKISELVAFFNLNSLSSPLMIRIHFDMLWTLIADTLYHILANDLRRFERLTSKSLFKQFIDMPGKVTYTGSEFIIRIRKRAATPLLKGVYKLNQPFRVPWLNNKLMSIEWTN